MKTSELVGTALDWAVAIAEGIPVEELKLPQWKGCGLFRYTRDEDGNLDGYYVTGPDLLFSSKWEAGGPIMGRIHGLETKSWLESNPQSKYEVHIHNHDGNYIEFGPTLLVAAMRCYVALLLGDEVEIPRSLL